MNSDRFCGILQHNPPIDVVQSCIDQYTNREYDKDILLVAYIYSTVDVLKLLLSNGFKPGNMIGKVLQFGNQLKKLQLIIDYGAILRPRILLDAHPLSNDVLEILLKANVNPNVILDGEPILHTYIRKRINTDDKIHLLLRYESKGNK